MWIVLLITSQALLPLFVEVRFTWERDSLPDFHRFLTTSFQIVCFVSIQQHQCLILQLAPLQMRQNQLRCWWDRDINYTDTEQHELPADEIATSTPLLVRSQTELRCWWDRNLNYVDTQTTSITLPVTSIYSSSRCESSTCNASTNSSNSKCISNTCSKLGKLGYIS